MPEATSLSHVVKWPEVWPRVVAVFLAGIMGYQASISKPRSRTKRVFVNVYVNVL